MRETEKAYIAGIIDGEGYIGISKSYSNNNKIVKYHCHIVVVNTDKRLINYLQSKTNSGEVEITESNGNRKKTYRWRVTGVNKENFLNEVLDFLVIKKDQAILMLEFINLNKEKKFQNSPATDRERMLKRVIYEELRELNKRGIQ